MQAGVEELIQGPMVDHITRLQGVEGDEVALESAFELKESLHSLLLSLDPRYIYLPYMALRTAAAYVITGTQQHKCIS